MQKKTKKSKGFSAHFEDLEACWVNVSAIIKSIRIHCVFLTQKAIGLRYKVENYRFVLFLSTLSIDRRNLEGKSV